MVYAFDGNGGCSSLTSDTASFLPCPSTIEKLERKATAQLLAVSTKRIAPETAISALDQYFVCTICQQVVEEPTECQSCNDLCCIDCINQWRQRKNTCPSCRCSYDLEEQTMTQGSKLKPKPINRFIKSLLDKADFKCDACQSSFKYEGRFMHWESCQLAL